ncbi:MAG: hypothetical protein FWC55_01260, partial [Firmicutes bacterium]|nr:hypothetical protein [Bacillota bacterium]
MFFLKTTLLTLKMILTPYLLVFALLFPPAVYGASEVLALGGDGGIRVGLLSSPGEVADKAAAYFEKSLGGQAAVVTYGAGELDRMKKDVERRYLDCAYALDAAKLEKGDYAGAVTVYRTDAAFSDKYAGLAMTAAELETMAGALGLGVLQKHFPDAPPADIAADVQARTDAYLKDGPLMRIDRREILGGLGGDAGGRSAPGYGPRGAVAVFAALLALICAFSLRGVGKAAAARGGILGAKAVLMGVSGAAAIFLVQAVFFAAAGLIFGAPASEIPAMAAYAAANALAGAALARWTGENVFPALISFLFVMTGLFGGVFFQVKEIAPRLAWVQWLFPSFYYMRA